PKIGHWLSACCYTHDETVRRYFGRPQHKKRRAGQIAAPADCAFASNKRRYAAYGRRLFVFRPPFVRLVSCGLSLATISSVPQPTLIDSTCTCTSIRSLAPTGLRI